MYLGDGLPWFSVWAVTLAGRRALAGRWCL